METLSQSRHVTAAMANGAKEQRPKPPHELLQRPLRCVASSREEIVFVALTDLVKSHGALHRRYDAGDRRWVMNYCCIWVRMGRLSSDVTEQQALTLIKEEPEARPKGRSQDELVAAAAKAKRAMHVATGGAEGVGEDADGGGVSDVDTSDATKDVGVLAPGQVVE
jgi:hypothetical protein